jgi:hypothetical protein
VIVFGHGGIAVEVRGAGDLDSAFALIAKERVGALMVSSDIIMVDLAVCEFVNRIGHNRSLKTFPQTSQSDALRYAIALPSVVRFFTEI